MKITTRKQAIDENCKDCVYDPSNGGTWRQQVEDCTIPSCSLFAFRPVTLELIEERKREKMAAMTPDELKVYLKRADAARERFAKQRG